MTAIANAYISAPLADAKFLSKGAQLTNQGSMLYAQMMHNPSFQGTLLDKAAHRP